MPNKYEHIRKSSPAKIEALYELAMQLERSADNPMNNAMRRKKMERISFRILDRARVLDSAYRAERAGDFEQYSSTPTL